MKSTLYILASILISLALVNAAPTPSPQGSLLSGVVGLLEPVAQGYCKDEDGNTVKFDDPVCAEYSGYEGGSATGAQAARRQLNL